jgi:AP-1-like transcription factor
MLNEAKQRNDILGQAYAALHAEYVQLKASQFKDYQQQPPQMQQPDPLAYGTSATMPLATGNDRLDMDLFVYGDMSANAGTAAATYTLH